MSGLDVIIAPFALIATRSEPDEQQAGSRRDTTQIETYLAPSFVSILPVHPFDSVSVNSASSSSTTGLFASTHLYVITPDPRRLKYRSAFSGGSTDFGSSAPHAVAALATIGLAAVGDSAFWRSCKVITASFSECECAREIKLGVWGCRDPCKDGESRPRMPGGRASFAPRSCHVGLVVGNAVFDTQEPP